MEEFLKATPSELVRRYGAVKRDSYYEVPALNAPWVFARPFAAELRPGVRYRLEGVSASFSGRGEAYIVLTDGEVGYGFILAQGRRRMFKCIRRPYAAPQGVSPPAYIKIKPMALTLSDSPLIECVDGPLAVKAVAVLPAAYSVYRSMSVAFGALSLAEVK
ncbi:MAG: hypothetical protein TU35_009560 [Thermoproteus sp. AZ2]|uniref:Uncharacterized protein n=1 Tax=Thermoproteus sp. AZ2 TaxID=1609232 RepID=A0ACC6V337_9CREN